MHKDIVLGQSRNGTEKGPQIHLLWSRPASLLVWTDDGYSRLELRVLCDILSLEAALVRDRGHKQPKLPV